MGREGKRVQPVRDPQLLLERLARREIARRDLIEEARSTLELALAGNPSAVDLRNSAARAVVALEDALALGGGAIPD